MDDGRLMKMNNVLATHRKNTSNLNYIARERYKAESRGFTRQQTLLDVRHNLNTRRVKQSLVELRGMQKVLRRRTEFGGLRHSCPNFGKYGGATLDDLKPEVTQIIRENHPRVRRMRKTERMLSEGLQTGRLIEAESVKERFDRIMALPTLPANAVPSRSQTCVFEHFSDQTRRGLTYGGNRLVLPPIEIKRNTKASIVIPTADMMEITE